MNRAVISLGSNIPDKDRILATVMSTIDVKVMERTPAYMDTDDNNDYAPYLNIVAIVETRLDHDTLLAYFKEKERKAGRKPSDKETGLIPLDIDIVIFNGVIMREADFARPYFQHGYSLLNTRP